MSDQETNIMTKDDKILLRKLIDKYEDENKWLLGAEAVREIIDRLSDEDSACVFGFGDGRQTATYYSGTRSSIGATLVRLIYSIEAKLYTGFKIAMKFLKSDVSVN